MSGDVLIIEADEDVAGQIADAVGRHGLSPRITNDGKDGYDLAQAARPAAIVLCAELPKVSGYSICAKLKKDPGLKDVPLIFTSAEASESTFEHHKKLKVRADEYLSKPFPVPRLLELLGRHLPLNGHGEGSFDEVDVSEEISIEDEPELVDESPFGGEGASASTDLAFDAALDVISEQPSVERPTETPAPAAPEAPSLQAPPTSGSLGEGRAPPLRTADIENAAGSSAASQRALLQLKKELNSKNRELFDLQDRLHAKERELLELRDRETEFEDQIVQSEEKSEALAARLRDAEAARERLEREKSEVEQRAQEAEQRVHTLRSELEQAETERAALESARSTAESQLSELRAELEAVRGDLEVTQREREAAESERDQFRSRAQDAEDAAAKARSALETGLEILRRLGSDPS